MYKSLNPLSNSSSKLISPSPVFFWMIFSSHFRNFSPLYHPKYLLTLLTPPANKYLPSLNLEKLVEYKSSSISAEEYPSETHNAVIAPAEVPPTFSIVGSKHLFSN